MSKLKVIKRDGLIKDFDEGRIISAVKKAYEEAELEVNIDILGDILKKVQEVGKDKERLSVEEIQDVVVDILKKEENIVGELYEKYRLEREEVRIKQSKREKFYNEVLNCTNVDNDNANVNQYSFSGKKYRIADYEQKMYALRNLISKEGREAFENGEIYYHDLSSYAIGEHNCLFADIDYCLSHGFKTRNGDVRPAQSFATACQLIAVIFQCQSQIQYGGVAAQHLDFSLAHYVKLSFRKHFREGLYYLKNMTEEQINLILPNEVMSIEDERYKELGEDAYKYAYGMLNKEGKQSTQGLYHNLNTLESRAGSQLPFTSINLGRDTSPEGRLVNKWIFEASINGIGKLNSTSIFPISIFQYKKGVNAKKGDPNYDLKQLALKSLTKRIYPNIVNGDYKQNIEDPNNPDTFMATMGCRTMTLYDIISDSYVKNGRGNISPITIILPKIGIEYGICLGKRDKADIEGFKKKLQQLLELVRDELIARYEYICDQSPKSAPFMYDNGIAMDSLKCKETVRECLKHGTNAIGIIGMAECCVAMFGKHHGESVEAYEFAYEIVNMIDKFCKKTSKDKNMNFSQYFTPAENLCKTAMTALKLQYGEIKGVTERSYLTNSIHIPVYYQIDAYSKLTLEAPFTQFGTGGVISYCEMDNNAMQNIEGIEKLIDFAMDLNIPYLAINFPIDTCKTCGYSSQIDGDVCPKCGGTIIERLKRVTGYITVDYRNFNSGKFDEANDRVVHTIFNPQVIPVIKVAHEKLKELGIGEFEVQ